VDEEAIRRAKCEDVEVEYSPSWDADTVILDREEGKRKRAMWGGEGGVRREGNCRQVLWWSTVLPGTRIP